MALPSLYESAYPGGMTLNLVRAIEPQWQVPCGSSTFASSRIDESYLGRWRG